MQDNTVHACLCQM